MAFGLAQGLRRQLDAHDIDMDTFKGTVKFRVYPPSTLHLDRIAGVVRGNGFTLRRITGRLFGEVTAGGYVVRLRGTGQEIELDEAADEDDSAAFELTLDG